LIETRGFIYKTVKRQRQNREGILRMDNQNLLEEDKVKVGMKTTAACLE